MTRLATISADELLRINLPTKRTELIRGRLVVREPAGFQHGEVALRIGAAIAAFVYQRKLGHVLAAETGFKIESDPDTVRAPDVAFVRVGRIPTPPPRNYPALAPDLAVEVLSPGESAAEVDEKTAAWLDAGTLLVWVIDPIRQVALVHRSDKTMTVIPMSGALDGESVLPGFSCHLRDFFE
jgi:Uma2 family endonuclease